MVKSMARITLSEYFIMAMDTMMHCVVQLPVHRPSCKISWFLLCLFHGKNVCAGTNRFQYIFCVLSLLCFCLRSPKESIRTSSKWVYILLSQLLKTSCFGFTSNTPALTIFLWLLTGSNKEEQRCNRSVVIVKILNCTAIALLIDLTICYEFRTCKIVRRLDWFQFILD